MRSDGQAERRPRLQTRLVVLVGALAVVFAVGELAVTATASSDVRAGAWWLHIVLAAGAVVSGATATYLAVRPTVRRLRRLTDHVVRGRTRVVPELEAAAVSGQLDPGALDLPVPDLGGDDDVSELAANLVAYTAGLHDVVVASAGRVAGADARFRAGFERSPAAMAVLDGRGVIIEANDAFAQLIGVDDPELLIGSEWLERIHADDRPLARAAVGGEDTVHAVTIRYLRMSGETAHVQQTWVAVTGTGGEHLSFLQGQDVSEARRATETLQRLAFTDLLTGLPNRAALENRLADTADRVDPDRMVALAVLDLDRFKLINDSLGHHEGDRVLRAVGKRLRAAIPPDAFVARTGGDEFAIVVPDVPDRAVLEVVAERLLAVLEAPIAIGGRRFHVTASIGFAVAETPATVELLAAQADAASYAAKASGRRRWMMFDATMAQEATERLALENDLREALGNHQLELHYQPIVDSADRHLTGMEALVRWRHPERGLLAPDVFIPLAEDTGLIDLLGSEVLDLALGAVRRLEGIADIDQTWRMSVNISPAQLRHPEFVADVDAKLRNHGVPASRVMLEITESMLIEDDLLDRVQDLRRLGIWIALDDFGTGYTGVAYLSRVGVDVLKIDRSIVKHGHERRGHAVLRTIGELGTALGMHVVAEGVDDEDDIALAADCSCDRLQGFGVSRPVAMTELATRVLPALAGLT